MACHYILFEEGSKDVTKVVSSECIINKKFQFPESNAFLESMDNIIPVTLLLFMNKPVFSNNLMFIS